MCLQKSYNYIVIIIFLNIIFQISDIIIDKLILEI